MYLVLINSFRKKKKEKFILGREISPGKNFLLGAHSSLRERLVNNVSAIRWKAFVETSLLVRHWCYLCRRARQFFEDPLWKAKQPEAI